MAKIELDRMALDDAGANPERLAQAIHKQLGELPGSVPVIDIAHALDIEEIREEPLEGFEGALITTPERSFGAIVVNSRSSLARRRYTTGHELGHFLNPWHRPTTGARFECTRRDMLTAAGEDRHRRQEAEANQFAIELLAPRPRLKSYMSKAADLANALDIAKDFEISKAAATRRYVSLHDEQLAVVFSRNGHVSYFCGGSSFPRLSMRAGDRIPALATPDPGEKLSPMNAAQFDDWLSTPGRCELYAQTLFQADGYAMTLLLVERAECPEDCADDAEPRWPARPGFRRGS